MQRTGSVVALLVLALASVRVLQALALSFTQENFDLDKFMGKWYELAVVSSCPHFMQDRTENPVVVAVELQYAGSEGNFTMTSTRLRNDTCQQSSTLHLTLTPGHFFSHVARFGADVNTLVSRTNYDEYAMMLLLSEEKPSGANHTTVKLFSRTMNVTAAVMDDFKQMTRQRGLTPDAIIMNQDKGECVPADGA